MEHGRAYRHSQSSHTTSPWADQHLCPHSHHGTPATEHNTFNWGQPPLPDAMPYPQHIPGAQYQDPYDQRLDQPLPQWPSQLTEGHQAMYKTITYSPPQNLPMVDPFAPQVMPAAPAASGPSNTPNPRRTLTDDDRRDMCKFAAEHPGMKQTVIGARFKVDRSTVSKVLRQKDKFLANRSSSRPPVKREKSRRGEVEKALNAWALNQRKHRTPLTDDSIREQATHFAAAAGGDNSNPATNINWVAKFKRNHSYSASRGTPVSDELEATSNAGSRDSKSPSNALSPAVRGLRMMTSNEDLQSGISDTTSDHQSPSQAPGMSLTSALQDHNNYPPDFFPDSSPYFSPVSGPPITFAQRNTRPTAPLSRSSSDRQRRSTFPQMELNPYMHTSSSDAMSKLPSTLLDSPMNEYNSLIESTEEHFYTDFSNPTSYPTSVIESATISPSDMMHAPPLPSKHRRDSSLPSPSQAEASAGLAVAMRYLQKHRHELDEDEVTAMLNLQQKLNSLPPSTMH